MFDTLHLCLDPRASVKRILTNIAQNLLKINIRATNILPTYDKLKSLR